VAQKIVWVLGLLEELEFVPGPYFKKLSGTGEIWECRISFGSEAFRILCFFGGEPSIVLTHGFIKKTTKTPRNEIERAEAYKKDYLERKVSHERS
jgi:phage-related protein